MESVSELLSLLPLGLGVDLALSQLDGSLLKATLDVLEPAVDLLAS